MLFVFLFCAPAQAEEFLWKMQLENREAGDAPEFGEGLQIQVEDGKKMLSKTEERGLFFPANILSNQETASWNNIVFQVRYREHGSSGMRLAVKRHGLRSEADYLWYYVHIKQNAIEVSCHGLGAEASVDPADPRLWSSMKYEDLGEAPLVRGEWITAEVQVGDEVIKVSVSTEDGSTRKAEFKTLPGAGGVQMLAYAPTDVLSATVRDADSEVKNTQ